MLYGSQTGNAEHIARDLYDKLTEMGLKSTYSTLNAVKKVNFKETAHAVIIGESASFRISLYGPAIIHL